MQYDRFDGAWQDNTASIYDTPLVAEDDTPLMAEAATPISATTGPLAATTTTVIAYPYTGDYRIDVLIDSDPADFPAVDYRWNYTTPMASPVTVTYSFMTAVPLYGGNTDVSGASGFSVFTAQEMAATRQIMQHVSAEFGINLVEVADSAFSYGQIRLGNNRQDFTAGYAWLPNSTGDDKSGDVWIDNSSTFLLNHVTPGSEIYATLLHEIGHALGLKHPGNYNAGDPTSQDPGNYLGIAEDNYNFTVMSYNEVAGGQQRDWYGMYDLLALRALYGGNNYNAGNTTYTFDDTAGTMLKIIDDASGYDTIDLSALSLGATVDLRPGGFSSVGKSGFAVVTNNLSIDANTVIENFIGTSFSDRIVLPTGTLAIDGRAGIDTVGYSMPRANYQAAVSGTTLHVTRDGVDDTLSNVERLEFSDHKFAYDFAGNAGIVAKVLGAVFGQGSHPIPQFAAVGLQVLDSGTMNYSTLMQASIDYQLTAQHTHAAVVNMLYTNIAGFAPSAADLAYYTGLLDNHTFTEAGLGIAAADTDYNLTHIDFVGQSQAGLAFG